MKASKSSSAPSRVRLKWHRLQRASVDTPFTRSRLQEGLALGASMEVDLRMCADGGFACVHDDTLDRETTGVGSVYATSSVALGHIHLRDNGGNPSEEPVLLFDELCALANDGRAAALIQLDLKETIDRLDTTCIDKFLRVVEPCVDRLILSGEDWAAVKRLGVELARSSARLRSVREFGSPRSSLMQPTLTDLRGLVCSTAPEATTIYLEYRLVLAGLAAGSDFVAKFHRHNRLVDAWTLDLHLPDSPEALRSLVTAGVDQITTGDSCGYGEALGRNLSISVGSSSGT